MNRIDSMTKPLAGFMALLLAVLVAGCGGGSDPILGGGGAGTSPVVVVLDTTAPRLVSVDAASGVINVPINRATTATFSEPMAPATLTSASPSTAVGTTFTMCSTATQGSACVASVAGVVTYAGNTATFKPDAILAISTWYKSTITASAKDLAGNALVVPPVAGGLPNPWSWQTSAASDVVAPTVTATSPADLATNVAINNTVNATFSKAMTPATIGTASFTLATSAVPAVSVLGTVAYDAVNHIATFKPSSNLAPSTIYKATITSAATDLASNALAAALIPNPWTFTTAASAVPPASLAINLGSAASFGIMATAAVTAASASTINGDVSLAPGTSMTGFPPAIVNGSIHINDTVATQAQADLLSAYNNAKGLACVPANAVGTADLGGLYVYPTGIPPGVYCSGSTMLVGTHIVLDAAGDANAVWVFQIGSSLTTGADVTLANGAQAKNIFWVPTEDATIGSGTIFNGTIVSGRDATSAGSATINGRILAGAITAGTIALNGPPSTINVPAP